MTNQLPAHLQNRANRGIVDRASEGMGTVLPPHISIQGNSFTFIDAAGNELQPILTFDAAIIDISDRMCKRYYDKPFDPNASTYEPPACWSGNGITPSREVATPQALECAQCPQNQRGSAVSRISGAAIKACRDEKWLAILVPQMPTVIFQLVLTPGSFTNFKAYVETVKNYGVDLGYAKTRFSFQPKTNGVLVFEMVDYVDAPTADVVELAIREQKTDAIVGRTDLPRQIALAAPAAAPALAAPAAPSFLPPTAVTMAPSPVPPAAFPQTAPAAPAAFPQAAQPAASPSEAAPARRRRRPAVEAAAPAAPSFAPAPAAPQAPFGGNPAASARAPFPAGNAAPAAPGAPQFGMAPGAPVNPEMQAMLDQMGFKPQG